jgi:hypothetical protein
MIYGQEKFETVSEEIKPLIEEHYHEIAKYKDIPLEPDWACYKAMETLGVLKIFTCRDEDTNALIGYSIYFVRAHIHYKTCLTAQQDILFIRKEYRGKGMRFIKWCDEQLKAMGVQMTIHHVKAAHNFGPMLERIGYELMDLIYTRRLD